jgi:hypothetical protein
MRDEVESTINQDLYIKPGEFDIRNYLKGE